jgi:hypothetical protein
MAKDLTDWPVGQPASYPRILVLLSTIIGLMSMIAILKALLRWKDKLCFVTRIFSLFFHTIRVCTHLGYSRLVIRV